MTNRGILWKKKYKSLLELITVETGPGWSLKKLYGRMSRYFSLLKRV